GYALVQTSWYETARPAERAVDLAWTHGVPRLHAEGFRTADSAFLAGLALTSAAGLGQPQARAGALQQLLLQTKKAVADGTGSVVHLAALWRLAVADTAVLGGDPVGVVVTQVSHYVNNKLPLAFAEHLLGGCRGDAWLSERREQLRILLLERAFEAGLEVRDLTAIGQAAPSLRRTLRTDDADGLARLRLLWSMRPRRPWDRCGQAVTAFDLAGSDSRAGRLKQVPDLLLEATEPPAVLLTNRGLAFQGKVFAELPRRIEVRRAGKREYELQVDDQRLLMPDHPGRWVIHFQRWCQFFFQEFLPELPKVHLWQAPNAPPLTMHVAVRCPECRHALLTRAGELAAEVNPEAFGLSAAGE
ncbi:MAG TPA: hypothetical protein VFA18_02955, partial [Gemmataceae bacterium]|nr:hypothetical protein [Gemmataceae bacterium]